MHEVFKREQILSNFEKKLKPAYRIIISALESGLDEAYEAGMDLEEMLELMQRRNIEFAQCLAENPEILTSEDDED